MLPQSQIVRRVPPYHLRVSLPSSPKYVILQELHTQHPASHLYCPQQVTSDCCPQQEHSAHPPPHRHKGQVANAHVQAVIVARREAPHRPTPITHVTQPVR